MEGQQAIERKGGAVSTNAIDVERSEGKIRSDDKYEDVRSKGPDLLSLASSFTNFTAQLSRGETQLVRATGYKCAAIATSKC